MEVLEQSFQMLADEIAELKMEIEKNEVLINSLMLKSTSRDVHAFFSNNVVSECPNERESIRKTILRKVPLSVKEKQRVHRAWGKMTPCMLKKATKLLFMDEVDIDSLPIQVLRDLEFILCDGAYSNGDTVRVWDEKWVTGKVMLPGPTYKTWVVGRNGKRIVVDNSMIRRIYSSA